MATMKVFCPTRCWRGSKARPGRAAIPTPVNMSAPPRPGPRGQDRPPATPDRRGAGEWGWGAVVAGGAGGGAAAGGW